MRSRIQAALGLGLFACAACSAAALHESKALEQRSFEELFDGRSLSGWVTRGGRYDGHASWTIEDGTLTGREGPGGTGGLIYTEFAYADFEFEVEVKIDYPFDSGIFLRMVPDLKGLQVTIDYRPDGEVGGIYSDGWLQHNPEGKARFKRGEWNHFRVRCSGADMRTLVSMNAEPLMEYRLPPGSDGYARSGLIGLQVHGASGSPEGHKVQFRGMRVRELIHEAEPAAFAGAGETLRVTAHGSEQGWRALFNGRDLDGWESVGGDSGVAVEEGELSFHVSAEGGYIRTLEDFRDFELRLDFKLAEMANSGVFLRGDRQQPNPAYSGCEVQILDDFNWEAKTGSQLADYQFSGGLYGSVAPAFDDALRPLGEWNTYEILYSGSRLRVSLNGKQLYDVDTLEVPGEPAFSERAESGFIGLQRHAPPEAGSEPYVRFRNIFLRPL